MNRFLQRLESEKYAKLTFLLFFSLVCATSIGQDIEVITSLSSELGETSGLLYLDGVVITHNDSGHEPELYEIDTLTGFVSRTVHITNATNRDWEDVSADSTYIYIGDFGNNNGDRRDLVIYRIERSAYVALDTVPAERITFEYDDQVDFTPAPMATNFDAEALIAYGDSLYIFSKNWGDGRCNVYRLGKSPGAQIAMHDFSFDPQGLVTGANYDPESRVIVLCGYALIFPFMVEMRDFSSLSNFDGEIEKTFLQWPDGYSVQAEGVAFDTSGNILFTSESGALGDAGLYALRRKTTAISDWSFQEEIYIYPNPAKDVVYISAETEIASIELCDLTGRRIQISHGNSLPLFQLTSGMYIFVARNSVGRIVFIDKLVVT